jgi:hypothetical protein
MEVVVPFKSSFHVIVSALVLAAGLPAFAQSPQSPTGSWAVETPASGSIAYNFSSPYGGSASDGTYLYIFGGYQYGAYVSAPQYYQTCRRYDPASNVWTTMALMYYPTYYNAGAYYNGRVYSFGGYNYNQGWVATWQYYQISTDTWSMGPTNMSSPRYYHSVAEMNGTIYMTAGYNPNTGPVTTHEAFNPSTNQWSSPAATPGYQYYHGLAAVPAVNKLYSMGGYGVAGYTGINYEYDVAANSWTTRAPISNGSAQQNMIYVRPLVLSNRVYIAGGQNVNSGITQTTFEYNAFDNAWTQRASMNYLHYMHGVGVINNKGYVYGGPNYPTKFRRPAPAPAERAKRPRWVGRRRQLFRPRRIRRRSILDEQQIVHDVTDPDAAQQVQFRVQVTPAARSGRRRTRSRRCRRRSARRARTR